MSDILDLQKNFINDAIMPIRRPSCNLQIDTKQGPDLKLQASEVLHSRLVGHQVYTIVLVSYDVIVIKIFTKIMSILKKTSMYKNQLKLIIWKTLLTEAYYKW